MVIKDEFPNLSPLAPVPIGEEIDIEKIKPKDQKDILLITGDGTHLLDDIEAFLEFGMSFDTMCINYSATLIPWPIQHFVAGDSHQPDMQKVAKTLTNGVIKHCWNPNSLGFDVRWIRNGRGGWTGTTANLAMKIGIILDYGRIVLAGVPMDKSGNWYKSFIPDNDIKQDKDHRHHLWKWTEIATRPLARFIRSMSGNTADLFGKPTKEWLLYLPEKGE